MPEPTPAGPRVTVRHWAAARAAAGVAEEALDAASLVELVERLGRRHGPGLTRVLGYCTFVVDGAPAGGRRVRQGAVTSTAEPVPVPDVALHDGAVVEVLPPFAGGAGAVTVDGASPSPVGALSQGALVVLLAAVLAVASALARPVLGVVLLALQAVLVVAWVRRLEQGSALLVLPALAAVAADAVLLADRHQGAGSVAGVVGLAFVAALLQQIADRGRHSVTARLACVVPASGLVAALALLLPLREHGEGAVPALVVATALAVAAAVLVGQAVGADGIAAVLAAAVLGCLLGAAGGLLVALFGSLSVGAGAVVGAAAGAGAAVAAVAGDRARAGLVLRVLMPVVAATPLGYLAVRLVA